MNIVLFPCGATAWRAEGRLLGRVEVPPAGDASERCQFWALQAEPAAPRTLLHAPDELCSLTAERLASELRAAPQPAKWLAEPDLGLWAGLTCGQLKSRFGTVHKQLLEAPLTVSPPGGEALEDAAARLGDGLQSWLRRNGRGSFGLVVRPVAFAFFRCLLENRSLSDLWPLVQQDDAPLIFDANRLATATPA